MKHEALTKTVYVFFVQTRKDIITKPELSYCSVRPVLY